MLNFNENLREENIRWGETYFSHPTVIGWNVLAKTERDNPLIWRALASNILSSVRIDEVMGVSDRARAHNILNYLMCHTTFDVHKCLSEHAPREWGKTLVSGALDGLIEQGRGREAKVWADWLKFSKTVDREIKMKLKVSGIKGLLKSSITLNQEEFIKQSEIVESWIDVESVSRLLSEREDNLMHWIELVREPVALDWLEKFGGIPIEMKFERLWSALYSLQTNRLMWLIEHIPYSKESAVEFMKSRTHRPVFAISQLIWGLERYGKQAFENGLNVDEAFDEEKTAVLSSVVQWLSNDWEKTSGIFYRRESGLWSTYLTCEETWIKAYDERRDHRATPAKFLLHLLSPIIKSHFGPAIDMRTEMLVAAVTSDEEKNFLDVAMSDWLSDTN